MKLVQLTTGKDNKPTFVEAFQIVQISAGASGSGSDLVTSAGFIISVNEAPAAVAAAFGYVAP